MRGILGETSGVERQSGVGWRRSRHKSHFCFDQIVDSLLIVRRGAGWQFHFCQRDLGLEEQVGIALPGTQESPLGWPGCSLQSSETREPPPWRGERRVEMLSLCLEWREDGRSSCCSQVFVFPSLLGREVSALFPETAKRQGLVPYLAWPFSVQ